MGKDKFMAGQKVMVTYGKFGEAIILNNGKKNQFNHLEKIYKVQCIKTGVIQSFNELHFKPIN